MKYNKYEIADYIAGKYPGTVTPMKLQKLLYYCYAWQLVAGKKLFDATFQAWQYGPVEPGIYGNYKRFKKDPVAYAGLISGPIDLIDFIADSYAEFSAIELSKTTHQETPWKKYAGMNEPISDQDMIEFYINQPFAQNFTSAGQGKYYPPKTASHYSFTFDMEQDYVPEFNSLDEFLADFRAEKQRLAAMMQNYEPVH